MKPASALMLITHDLGVVSKMTDRIAVMYAGRIVETGRTNAAPSHGTSLCARGLFAASLHGAAPACHSATGRPRLAAIPASCLTRWRACRRTFADRCAFRRAIAAWAILPLDRLTRMRALRIALPVSIRRTGNAVQRCRHERRRSCKVRDVDAESISLRARRSSQSQLPCVFSTGVSWLKSEGRAEPWHRWGKAWFWQIPSLARARHGAGTPAIGVRFIINGQDIYALDRSGLREARARAFRRFFRDRPMSSLWSAPYRQAYHFLRRLLRLERGTSAREASATTAWPKCWRRKIGYARRASAEKVPHEFSGGHSVSACTARALITRPALIVADEPVSALDVSIQAQVLNLMMDLQEKFGLSYLFISHDLGVVRAITDRVAVIYRGNIVEEGPTAEVFDHPRHDYTRALVDAVPKPFFRTPQAGAPPQSHE